MSFKKNPLYKNAIEILNTSMDNIDFNKLTVADAETIRRNIYKARNSILALADSHPDHNGEFSALLKMADFIEKAVNAADDSTTYL